MKNTAFLRNDCSSTSSTVGVPRGYTSHLVSNGIDLRIVVYPGETENPNEQRDHRKIEKLVSLDLCSFMLQITDPLPKRYRHNVRYLDYSFRA